MGLLALPGKRTDPVREAQALAALREARDSRRAASPARRAASPPGPRPARPTASRPADPCRPGLPAADRRPRR